MPATPPAPEPATPRWQRALPLLMLAVGAGLTGLAHREETATFQALRQARFQAQATEVAAALERHLHSNAALLRGVAGLFASSDDVNASEFRTYVQGLQLDTGYPWIQGVGFARWQPPAPGQSLGSSRIVYLEPMDWRNQRALGRDMYGEPVRQRAMAQAVASGQPTLSGRVTLLQETHTAPQAGLLMFMPIHGKPGVASATPALQGWAYSPLRAGDVVATLRTPNSPLARDHLRLEWFASDRADPDQLLYASEAPSAAPPLPIHHSEHLSLYGSQWHLRFRPTAAGLAALEDAHTRPNALLQGGILTLLATGLVAVMLRGRQRIAQALWLSQRSNQQLQAQQDELRLAGTVMAASPMGIVVTDAQRRIVSVNPAFTRITGYSADEVMGHTPRMLAAEPRPSAAQESLLARLQTNDHWEGELQNRRKNGEAYPEFLSICAVRNAQGQVAHYVGLFQDITERRQAEDRIRELAHHDYLTHLANRALLVERAGVELSLAKRYRRHPALLFIDLDRFKPVNDTYGHETGDAVLIEVAQRLTGLLRETDLVCRQGGDEFVVLLPDEPALAPVLALAERVVQAIEQPCTVGAHTIGLSASVGVARYPEHGDTVDRLIQSADEAMYRAKQQASGRVCLAEAPAGAGFGTPVAAEGTPGA
ncbi:diguanylate cyclase domain-containing protein [Aquabacterium sp. A08]|uniref:sensor domain-containing diguanylate cyclase n=1 Tax=Aquabacterium sp. A08 TaxID=2718532 RepID=UPI00141F540E|nr:diguanylate cyclase [Aquabacterium sp. A08]NIC43172.1 diguanylate cyclase [Aquabacterium sp. A08]